MVKKGAQHAGTGVDLLNKDCPRGDQMYAPPSGRGACCGRHSSPQWNVIECTAAVACLFSAFSSDRVMALGWVREIAHAHDVLVIVDSACMLPPRSNLYRYIRAGGDMVVYSARKGVRGPQGSGILVGRADLFEVAAVQASHPSFRVAE